MLAASIWLIDLLIAYDFFDDCFGICICQVQFDRWLHELHHTRWKSADSQTPNRITNVRTWNLHIWNDDAFDCKTKFYEPFQSRQVEVSVWW